MWPGLPRRALRLLIAACALAVSTPSIADPFKIITTEIELPLVPNSVIDLALRLGYYKRAGVDVELIRVQQTPSAIAALRSGVGDMANVSFDTALQLVARDQMRLKGVISPDKALPFIIAVRKNIAEPKQLEHRVFGVGRLGSVDYNLSRIVLAKLGVDVNQLRYLAVGQPLTRARALAAGQIDATTMSIGVWTSLEDRSDLAVMVTQADYFKAAPFLSKLSVVTDDVARSKAAQVQAVVEAIILASRDFARDPKLWVDAVEAAHPETKRNELERFADSYRDDWSVNGGLNLATAQLTTDMLYEGPDFESLRRVPPGEWIETSFIDAALKKDGVYPGGDPTGR